MSHSDSDKIGRREALRLLSLGFANIGISASCASSGLMQENMNFKKEFVAPSFSSIMKRRIPSTGEELPVIGVGTWQTFDVGTSSSERAPLEEVIKTFVSSGGKIIDSSPMYGNSEQVVGDIAAKTNLHSKLFIATKVWTTGKAAGIKQMEDSMKKLQTKTVDLMQVHNLVDVEAHLETLREWKQQGRVRYVGVTHYTASSYDAVARILKSHPLDFVQINYSVGEREAEERILPIALERKIAVIANRPFAGGDMFRRLRSRPLPVWSKEIDCDSWAQIMLKFITSHPAITCAIPGTSKVEHLLDNMKAGTGKLPDEKLRKLIVAEVISS